MLGQSCCCPFHFGRRYFYSGERQQGVRFGGDKGLARCIRSLPSGNHERNWQFSGAFRCKAKKCVKALEIKTLVPPKGLSYANLARESPLGANAENYLGLINDQYPDGEPVAGQVIKIIK